MAQNPPRSPVRQVIVTAEPRGRPGLAAIGICFILGGVVLATIMVQNGIVLPFLGVPSLPNLSLSAPVNTLPTPIAPNGQAPANFTEYRDADRHFALYYSRTWEHTTGTVTIDKQSVPSVTFAPTGVRQPQWTLVSLATVVTSDQLIDMTSALLAGLKYSAVAPTNGPLNHPAGPNNWTELDGTAVFNGQDVRFSVYVTTVNGHSYLVLATGLSLNFDKTMQENFDPMLKSLNLVS